MEFVKISNTIYASGITVRTPNHHRFFVNGQLGVNLGSVIRGEVVIDDSWEPFLEERRQKAAFRILVDSHADFCKVKNIRATDQGLPVPRKRQQIVVDVAKVVQEFIVHECLLVTQAGPWTFGPGHIELSDIWMSELLHVSPGSYQAILWLGRPMQHTPPPSPGMPIHQTSPPSPGMATQQALPPSPGMPTPSPSPGVPVPQAPPPSTGVPVSQAFQPSLETSEPGDVPLSDQIVRDLASIDKLLVELAVDAALLANMASSPLTQYRDGTDDPFDFDDLDMSL